MIDFTFIVVLVSILLFLVLIGLLAQVPIGIWIGVIATIFIIEAVKKLLTR